MSSAEKKIVDFVLHLPSDTNPYTAVATYLQKVSTPPKLSTWSTIAQRCALGLFVILFVQTVHLLYARVKVGAFKVWNFTRLGLYSVDVASGCAISYGSYTISDLDTVAITDLFLLDLANAGDRDLSGEIVLFGCKYMLVVLNAWFFLWVCACQCTSLVCESGLGEPAGTGRRLHPVIRVLMHATATVVLIVPTPIKFFFYIKVNMEYDMAKSILLGILRELHAKASTATPQNYNRMELLAMLKPAGDMLPHAHNMAVMTRKAITIYLVELFVLSILYVPLLAVSLGRLYSRSVSQKKLDMAASGGEANGQISKMGRKIREQRRRLVMHAIILYATVTMHVPILIAQLSYEGDGFLRDEAWLTLTRVGLTLPFSIGGNAITFVLNLHARNQLADAQAHNQAASTMTSSFEGTKQKETFMPKFNPGGKDVELSILPTYIGLNGSDAHLETIDTREAPFGSAGVRSNPTAVSMHVSKSSRKPSSKSLVPHSSVHFKQSYDRQTEKSEMSAEEYTTKY